MAQLSQLILGKCLYCDSPLKQSLKGRDKKFCDRECREKYQPYRQQEKESAE